MYKNCKNVIAFAINFLNRSLNKAVMDDETANLKETSTESRPFAQKTTKMLNFVSTNGPYPLVCMHFVDKFLNAHCGINWHFTFQKS